MKVLIFSFLLLVISACSEIPVKKIYIPNIPGYMTLKGDFHLHTEFSDGKVWPTVRVDEAVNEGLDIIAITDHIEYRKILRLVPRDADRSYQIAKPYADQKKILLVKGVEINQRFPPGHFNVLFIKDAQAIDKNDFKEDIKEAKKQGGVIIWNHPGLRSSDPVVSKWFEIHTWLYENKLLDGIEIYNHKKYYPKAFEWALEKNLTIFSNTDNHYRTGKDYDLEKTHRPLTLIFARERSLEAVKEAVIKGRTASLVDQTVRGREEWLHPLFAACVKSTRKGNRVELENQSDLCFKIEEETANGDVRYELKGKSSIVMEASKNDKLRVLNFKTSPDKVLEIKE
jgi:predicted metal-dependent phosphoesterase TrpH